MVYLYIDGNKRGYIDAKWIAITKREENIFIH